MSDYDRRGEVYLFRCGNYYKIGQTQTGVLNRLKAVQHGNPFEVILVHVIPSENSYSAEKYLHLKFANKRVRLEWFELSDADVQWFCRIKNISQAFLDKQNLLRPVPPAQRTSITKVCAYCGLSFRVEKNNSRNQRYCNILCRERDSRRRQKNAYTPRPTVPKPNSTRALRSYRECVVCNRALPAGFGPCCSRECALIYRQST